MTNKVEVKSVAAWDYDPFEGEHPGIMDADFTVEMNKIEKLRQPVLKAMIDRCKEQAKAEGFVIWDTPTFWTTTHQDNGRRVLVVDMQVMK